MKSFIVRSSLLAITAFVACFMLANQPALAAAEGPDSSLSGANSCATGAEDNCDAEPGQSACATSVSQCGTVQVIKAIIAFFIAFAGLAVVISIIIGGIQFSMSSGDPSKATAARRRIINAIIALIFFFFLFALLNFLIPGGPKVIL